MTEKYSYRLMCDNCLNSENIEIEFGVSVKEYRKTFTCKKCGVKNESWWNLAEKYRGINPENKWRFGCIRGVA